MNEKIFRASFSVAIIVLISCVILIMGILFEFFEEQLKDELITEAQYISHAIETGGLSYFDDFDVSDKRITLISENGTVVADTKADTDSLDNHLERPEVQEAFKNGSGVSQRYSDTFTEKTVYYAIRLEDGSVLRVSTKQYTVITILMGIIQPVLMVILLALILSFFLASRISASIIKPINAIDPDNPEKFDTYEELTPLVRKIASQKRIIEKQVREESETREQLRREFTANVSHELKTPLTSISGFAEMMQDDDTPAEIVSDFSKSIYDEAQRLISLVNDIIEISELDEGSVPFEKENVDIYELSSDIIRRLEPAAARKNVRLILKGSETIVFGAEKILDEMIYNLCDNAIKYNYENGTVTVDIGAVRDRTTISVSDTGIGIPEEEQSRVFERFYRVDKSHSKQLGGTGLGLSIVKHGAMYHNAEIQMKSQVHKGTTVTVTF
ncbi:MAG: ATP-binding protein [Clostridia bacterium]|nr:ATP-binding protein [Clostridia bacterium]